MFTILFKKGLFIFRRESHEKDGRATSDVTFRNKMWDGIPTCKICHVVTKSPLRGTLALGQRMARTHPHPSRFLFGGFLSNQGLAFLSLQTTRLCSDSDFLYFFSGDSSIRYNPIPALSSSLPLFFLLFFHYFRIFDSGRE